MIYSFDVFDTTFVRTTVTHSGIYQLMQKQFPFIYCECDMPDELRLNFTKIRLEAEVAVRDNPIATIYDIYNYIRDKCGISRDIYDQLINLEIDTMLNNINGVPEILAKIEERRNESDNILEPNVIFITDTIYPEPIIKQLLETVGAYRDGDKIYTSCTEGLSKSSGKLFKKVCEYNRISPNELCHTGDNYKMEIEPASRMGVNAIHFKGTKTNGYEKDIAGRSIKTPTLQSSVAAGIARMARLNTPAKPISNRDDWLYTTCMEIEDFLYEIGASVAGPQLVPYVSRVLRMAERDGLKRLYFISRDGQILMKIAEILGTDIELRYLYASRAAWYPALTDGKSRELLLGYLKQEGVFEHDKIGLVDTGYAGSLPTTLYRISNKEKPIISYFYTIVKPQDRTMSNCNIKGFFYDANYQRDMPFEYYNVFNLVEMFCAGDHGLVLGYNRTENGIEPTLDSKNNLNTESWGLESLRRGILEYARMYRKFNIDKMDFDIDIYRESMLRLFNSLIRSPTQQEAEVLGSFLFSHSMYDYDMKEFAPPLRVGDLTNIEDATRWLEASVKRSGISGILFYPECLKRRIKDKVIK